jgi:hypothetical protein
MLSHESQLYSACPVLVSGSCKRETTLEHLTVIETVVNACNNSPVIPNCLFSIATNGEVHRGAALALLTMKITPTLLQLHLTNNGMKIHEVKALLNPNDKQDVVLAV